MCATVVWAINGSACSETFLDETERRLGVAPQPTELRIASSRVRPSAVHFTLTRRMCDCDGVIGLRERPPVAGETAAAHLLGWLRELPTFAPHVARVAVLRAWSPDDVIVPARARGVAIADLDEPLLRGIEEDELVTLDYPPSGSARR